MPRPAAPGPKGPREDYPDTLPLGLWRLERLLDAFDPTLRKED